MPPRTAGSSYRPSSRTSTASTSEAGAARSGGTTDRRSSSTADFAAARRDGKWGAIDREGRTALPFRFDGVDTFSEGLFPVFKAAHPGDPDDPRGEWSFVRPDGEPAFPDRFETASPFDNGIAWCEAKGGRWGPFLREGRFLVPPIYDDPGWESGPFLSGWKSGDELENWFDRTGRIIVPAALDPAPSSFPSSPSRRGGVPPRENGENRP